MRVRACLVPRPNQESSLDLGEDATAESAVRSLGLHPDAVLVTRDGSAIPLDAPLADGDSLRLVLVASGG